MILYDIFFRQHVSRRFSNIPNPKKNKNEFLVTPKSTVLHFWGTQGAMITPPEDLHFFKDVKQQVMLENVVTYKDGTGNIGRYTKLGTNLRAEFLRSIGNSARYRRLIDVERLKTMPMQQVCYNYSNLDRAYFYPETIYTGYQRWYNKFRTFIDTLNEVIELTDRQQFIIINSPNTLPKVANLNRVEKAPNMTSAFIRVFDTHETRVILELWKWLGTSRSNSLLAGIKPSNYDKVNIIIRSRTGWICYRLDKLDEFRKPTEEELSLGIENRSGLDPDLYKRVWYKGILSALGNVINTEEEVLEESDGPNISSFMNKPVGEKITSKVIDNKSSKNILVNKIDDLEAEEDDVEDIVFEEDGELEEKLSGIHEDEDEDLDLAIKTKEIEKRLEEDNYFDSESSDDFFRELEEEIADIVDNEIEASEKAQDLKEAYEVKKKVTYNDTSELVLDEKYTRGLETPEESFQNIVNEYSERGLITSKQYERFIKQANTYKEIQIEDSYMSDYIKIKPEEIKISKAKPKKKISTVIDDSYIGSTVDDFNRKYNTEVLEKDILSMVLNLQRGGVALTNVKKEETENILGASVDYEFRVSPIEGIPSTIKVKLPKVDDEGVFKIGGNEYRLKMQQSTEMPIKKTDDRTVVLTTYYSKLFIKRTERKAYDYEDWVSKHIRLAILEGSTKITNVEISSVYKEDFKAPRVFTLLAKNFNKFTIKLEDNKELNFLFNLPDLFKDMDPKLREKLTTEALQVCGTSNGNLLCIDFNNEFFEVTITNNVINKTSLGFIEGLIDLDPSKAPIDFIEMKVGSPVIPVGILLSYLTGFNQLLALLKPRFRTVPNNRRVSLEPNEYRITFSDVTYVFDRRDRTAFLLLGGFERFKRFTKTYEVSNFNTPDVYFNLLEDMGLNSNSILSEMSCMEKLYIDPISRELLLNMNEPTDFIRLLIRSADMLTTDYVPEVKDRVRGYERFAGTVYKNIVSAYKEHYRKPNRSNSRLEVHPQAVFNAIKEDPAKQPLAVINPIEDIKQKDSLTHSGTGGRTDRSMNKVARLYKKSDRGLVSEASVDSSKVAVNNLASSNPNFNSVRGTYDDFNENDSASVTSLLSTPTLLSPYSLNDDQYCI